MSDEDTKFWIYAGGLPYELTEGDIICVFSQYGEIVEISLSRDRETGKSRGFCFIRYEDCKSCELAVDNFHGATIVGRKIKVSHATNTNAIKASKPAIVAPNDGNTSMPKVEDRHSTGRRNEQQLSPMLKARDDFESKIDRHKNSIPTNKRERDRDSPSPRKRHDRYSPRRDERPRHSDRDGRRRYEDDSPRSFRHSDRDTRHKDDRYDRHSGSKSRRAPKEDSPLPRRDRRHEDDDDNNSRRRDERQHSKHKHSKTQRRSSEERHHHSAGKRHRSSEEVEQRHHSRHKHHDHHKSSSRTQS